MMCIFDRSNGFQTPGGQLEGRPVFPNQNETSPTCFHHFWPLLCYKTFNICHNTNFLRFSAKLCVQTTSGDLSHTCCIGLQESVGASNTTCGRGNYLKTLCLDTGGQFWVEFWMHRLHTRCISFTNLSRGISTMRCDLVTMNRKYWTELTQTSFNGSEKVCSLQNWLSFLKSAFREISLGKNFNTWFVVEYGPSTLQTVPNSFIFGQYVD